MSDRPLGRADVVAIVFAMTFPTFSAWLYFVAFKESSFVPAFYSIGKVVQFALPIAWVLWVQERAVRFGSAAGFVSGPLLGLAIVAALFALYFGFLEGSEYLDVMHDRLVGRLEAFQIASKTKFILFAIFISLLHSFLEEYYWRWFVFGQLRTKLTFLAAATLSGIAFMGHHVIIINEYMRPEHFWSMTLFLSACVAVGGVLWAWVYERTRSLVGPWLSHLLVDAGIMVVGYDQIWG